jgi:hypothetical protein
MDKQHELGITPQTSQINLRVENNGDKLTSLFKGAVGMTPGVGSLLSEIVGIVIPNRHLERLLIFVEVLDQKVSHIDSAVLSLKMKDEEFTDLLEDALRQSTRALTPERRDYIASILATSLDEEQLSHADEKKLLALLNELTDPEIVTLKSYALWGEARSEFAEKHRETLRLQPPVMSDSLAIVEKYAMHKSYRTKLTEIGLLKPDFKTVRKGEMPEFDKDTGSLKSNGYKITGLGRVFLGYIDPENKALYNPNARF